MDGAFVAIVMIDQVKANELADQLATRGHRPYVVESTESLYKKAGEESIDVLLIANQLRSFFTGLDITERIGAECTPPVTVLLAPEAMREDPTVRRLRIFHVESPAASVETLTKLVLDAAEKSLLTRTFVCPRAQRLVSEAEGIEPLPPLILKIANSHRETLASPDELLADVAADPIASAAVLKVVNSSAIGRAKKTTDVDEGIRFLGVGRTISVVLTSGLLQNQERLITRAPKEIRRWYGRRSALVAHVAEQVGRQLESLPAETAFVHGLLQDAGMLILAQAHGDRYVRLHERVQEIPHLRLDAEERNQFGTSHADVTAALLRLLKLPKFFATIAARHHAPITESETSTADQAILRAIQIGESVANVADRPTPQRLMILNFLLSHYQERTPGQCSTTLIEGIQQVAKLSVISGLPAPDAQVLDGLIESIKSREENSAELDFDPYQTPSLGELADDAGPEEPAGPKLIPAAKKSKVLVLEDDASIARLVRKTLAGAGAETVHVECIQDALKLACEVDAVICDVHLGAEDGAGAITRLRSEGYNGPVIVISGDSSRSTVERILKAKISEYLVKPFSKDQLLDKLRKYPGLVPSCASPRPNPLGAEALPHAQTA